MGNKLCDYKILKISEVKPEKTPHPTEAKGPIKDKLKAGDTLDFDLGGQGSLF